MNRTPKVSICIPTYQQAPYIRQAVESALSQEFDDFEVVISDDQSTDDVRSYLLSLNDGRLRIVRPRHHLTMAENWALSAMSAVALSAEGARRLGDLFGGQGVSSQP